MEMEMRARSTSFIQRFKESRFAWGREMPTAVTKGVDDDAPENRFRTQTSFMHDADLQFSKKDVKARKADDGKLGARQPRGKSFRRNAPPVGFGATTASGGTMEINLDDDELFGAPPVPVQQQSEGKRRTKSFFRRMLDDEGPAAAAGGGAVAITVDDDLDPLANRARPAAPQPAPRTRTKSFFRRMLEGEDEDDPMAHAVPTRPVAPPPRQVTTARAQARPAEPAAPPQPSDDAVDEGLVLEDEADPMATMQPQPTTGKKKFTDI
jgi:hypothetical protein